ncbi:HBS1-like protein [Grifola frondosa]|uniref:Elongation factor 1 alpha-like protein n=1 Tax=Grifola frondosa TaxID=5627 RepID=A0A1C7MI78_GRIFR|nr:HBS1-like protein [Grifola frondosa]
MSRHRFVRNIDIGEELEDDALSDGADDDLSPEDYEQMINGLEQIRTTIGSAEESGLSDADIKEALYHYYFDVQRSVAWLLEEQDRKIAARDRRDVDGKPLPMIPADEEDDFADRQAWTRPASTSGRTNIPLIRLSQQEPLELYETASEDVVPKSSRLSTITERTETEDKIKISPAPPMIPVITLTVQPASARQSQATFPSSSTTDYGQPLESQQFDPNDLRPSPSDSALQPLSPYESAPPATPALSDAPSSSSTIRPPKVSVEVAPVEVLPDIPDYQSKSSLYPKQANPSQGLLPAKSLRSAGSGSEKTSKLSSLASSRSSASSVSSRSYTLDTSSVVTYPALRPSSGSVLSLGSDKSPSTSPSSISLHVRRAIQTALDLEAVDRKSPTEAPSSVTPSQRPSITHTSVKSTAPIAQISSDDVTNPTAATPQAPISPAGQAQTLDAKAEETVCRPAEPWLNIPQSRTEYLTPTANGSTATTAITTTYQSLGSLLTSRQSSLPPSILPPAPVATPLKAVRSAEPKQSKLAMKSKKAHLRLEPEPEEPVAAPQLPMFLLKDTRTSAKEREKALKSTPSKKATDSRSSSSASSRAASPAPNKAHKKATVGPSPKPPMSTQEETPPVEEPVKPPVALEKLLEEVRNSLSAENKAEKQSLSLVVIGHVDAGKSTLMGRLLYELGRVDERARVANERASSKMGKGSFSWAWELDGTQEERERQVTILDAPGHKDFVPNMISGASQADSALLVVDAATGEFEAGFERGGQTREHLLLVRSLGVGQVIVAVNKLDQVQWSRARYEEICTILRPFLVQSGFLPSKTKFVPVGAMEGINLVTRGKEAKALSEWYQGSALVDLLDELEPPVRDIMAPLRFPISNVFKGQGSGTTVSGRVCGGIVAVGERLRILPGDESATVKAIESDDKSLEWAASGSNVTLSLVAVDPVNLNIARIIVFDIQVPITTGTSVELYHHSHDVPAAISRLISTLDRSSGNVTKNNPRVLVKNSYAEVEITIRTSSYSGAVSSTRPIPLEPFAVNKEMGRILVRRGGETISAGIVLDIKS